MFIPSFSILQSFWKIKKKKTSNKWKMSLCGVLKISMKLFGDFNISTKCCHHFSGSLVENHFRDIFWEGFSYKYAMNLKSVQKEGLPGPFLAVYCMPLITCCFSKYFQIMYILAKISKYFALFKNFLAFFCLFSEKLQACPYFLEHALSTGVFLWILQNC